MSTALSTATDQTGRASTQIANDSEKLSEASIEAAKVMNMLSNSVGEVQNASQDQYAALVKADLQLREASQIAGAVAASAQNVAGVAMEGRQRVDNIVAANHRINEQVEKSSNQVRQLDEASQQIGAIVQSIEQIAEQTNLLALNAAIEAARAGEHGRGFAVVAEEVRKLAEQSAEATREISTLITNVRNKVGETVEAINSTAPLVQQGSALSEEAGQSLASIAAAAEKVAKDAHGVAGATEDIGTAMDGVRAKAEQAATLTEQMAAGSTQVSGAINTVAQISEGTAAGAEEMSATAEEVSASAVELNATADDLLKVVRKFKLDSKLSVVDGKRAA
jgi:methyl-accepting chemotaxis protein